MLRDRGSTLSLAVLLSATLPDRMHAGRGRFTGSVEPVLFRGWGDPERHAPSRWRLSIHGARDQVYVIHHVVSCTDSFAGGADVAGGHGQPPRNRGCHRSATSFFPECVMLNFGVRAIEEHD